MPRHGKTHFGPAGRSKVHKVMHEFKHHQLHSGKSGKIVKKRKQAIAIALSEARHVKTTHHRKKR
jgi:ribosomal protein L21E